MAKAPVPGTVKTRLRPLLGDRGCARLQTELIRRTAALAAAGHGRRAFLAFTPSGRPQRRQVRALVDPRVVLIAQRGGDLGQRMAAAIADTTARHPGPVILIGTDCPVLGSAHLTAATAVLAAGCDMVLGPAYDGGYYLIALARPAPAVFALPPTAWGGPHVAQLTVQAAHAAGLTVGFIDPEHDLDTPDDATTLLRDPRLPPSIAHILRAG